MEIFVQKFQGRPISACNGGVILSLAMSLEMGLTMAI